MQEELILKEIVQVNVICKLRKKCNHQTVVLSRILRTTPSPVWIQLVALEIFQIKQAELALS